MMRQYTAIKRQYPDAIVLFRLGDFYEMFGEDAKIAAPILEVVLTSRNKGEADAQPMCGIPHHAIDNYLGKLIEAGHKVALADQVEDPATARGIVRREVVRVVTPGTYDSQRWLQAEKNNFLLCLAQTEEALSAAWSDLSTGEIHLQNLTGSQTEQTSALRTLLAKLDPREIVLNEALLQADDPPAFVTHLKSESRRALFGHPDWAFVHSEAEKLLKTHFGVVDLTGFGVTHSDPAVVAAGALLSYLKTTQKTALPHLTRLQRHVEQGGMQLDESTIAALELVANQRDGSKSGSLLDILDDGLATPMGHRLLREWLLNPLVESTAIIMRLEAVEYFYTQESLQRELESLLSPLGDLARLSSRLGMQRIQPRELLKLQESLASLPRIRQLFAPVATFPAFLNSILNQINPLPEVVKEVALAIRPDAAAVLGKGGVIADGYHAELDELNAIGKSGKEYLRSLEQTERTRTGIASLKIGYNKVFGYYLEVTHTHKDKVPADYIRKQTLTGAERYITDDLKTHEAKVLGAEERIVQLEQSLYEQLLEKLLPALPALQDNAAALAQLDVLQNFAALARQRRYVAPTVNETGNLIIRSGRHPVVEHLVVEERFVDNDTELSTDQQQIMVITGPNMAGKSTYLRQAALIALMAQIGCFVAAQAAEVGIVDRIFTRVGAADNLARGQSTFMVEMSETANILHNASERSLIILDEIGRGTSTFDGLSIAWAVIEYLHGEKEKGPRTLFATHYHELIQLAEELPRVHNYNIAVRENNSKIIFLRKIVPGGVDQSYGIHVAELAGLPQTVIQRARQVLSQVEKSSTQLEQQVQTARPAPGQAQLGFTDLSAAPNPAIEALREIRIETLTPLEALNKLAELKKKSE